MEPARPRPRSRCFLVQEAGGAALLRAREGLGYPDDDELYDDLRQARLRIVSEHAMPVKWSFSKVDPTPESLRKFVIIATRD